MLWNVTSLDADNLARAMLNVWLPGNPINLQGDLTIYNLIIQYLPNQCR